MSRNRFPLPLLAIVLAIPVLAGAVRAQDEEMGADPPAANVEPGTLDTLMEQTSLGNVTQAAKNEYYAGHRALVRAAKLEEKLAETEPSKLEKARDKVKKAYEEAAAAYLRAIQTNPQLLEAYTELGQAYRALGKNAEAVQVHDAALKLDPEDVENIYGRGEAYLALNYLREAATTYTELAGAHQEHAQRLMASLKKWVAVHRENPGEIRPDAVEVLATWIEQQESGSG